MSCSGALDIDDNGRLRANNFNDNSSPNNWAFGSAPLPELLSPPFLPLPNVLYPPPQKKKHPPSPKATADRYCLLLHRDLASGTYQHSPYESFFVHDPKRRHIRKACVRDRLVHHTRHMTLRQIYEPRLYSGVYSNHIGKGIHRAVDALQRASWKESKNLTRLCWALKCDIKRFYDSVDHEILS